jgi:hypothetical protein
MDELWQRFRTFWTPVLWGLGIFLAGLIVVHVITDDPEAGQIANKRAGSQLGNRVTPSTAQIKAAKQGADELSGRVAAGPKRIDQRRGADQVLRRPSRRRCAPRCPRGLPRDPAVRRDTAAAAQANARHHRSPTGWRSSGPERVLLRLKAAVVSELPPPATGVDVGRSSIKGRRQRRPPGPAPPARTRSSRRSWTRRFAKVRSVDAVTIQAEVLGSSAGETIASDGQDRLTATSGRSRPLNLLTDSAT